VGQHGEILEKPLNGTWKVEAVDQDSRTVDVHFDRSQSTAPAVIMAMQALGEVRDVSIAEPLIDNIIKRLLETPA
jgi:ABC-type uncharacterized transport system ATPase subunit